jgi:hypothetical protein
MIKEVIKLILPLIVRWLVNRVEKAYKHAEKAGDEKKAYVIEMIESFMHEMGWSKDLDIAKLDMLIEKAVASMPSDIHKN